MKGEHQWKKTSEKKPSDVTFGMVSRQLLYIQASTLQGVVFQVAEAISERSGGLVQGSLQGPHNKAN
jgi:hypothetical protein